jgi:TatD DNase family protein
MHRIPDVHCHLEALPDPEHEVEAARKQGVGPILAVGMNAVSSTRSLVLRDRFPGQVLAAVGLHPSEIPVLGDADLQRELDFVRAALYRADALGEVGLDFKDAKDEVQRQRQRDAFAQQLEWAADLRKPVNVHCRRAEREIVTIGAEFAQRTGLGVDLHWFTHSLKLARECAAAGLFISPGPSILHDPEQARIAAAIAPEWLLLETDSPVEYAGEEARPSWAARVASHLAAVRGETLDGLVSRLQENWRRYLGIG